MTNTPYHKLPTYHHLVSPNPGWKEMMMSVLTVISGPCFIFQRRISYLLLLGIRSLPDDLPPSRTDHPLTTCIQATIRPFHYAQILSPPPHHLILIPSQWISVGGRRWRRWRWNRMMTLSSSIPPRTGFHLFYRKEEGGR